MNYLKNEKELVNMNYLENEKDQKRGGDVAVVMSCPWVMFPYLCCTSSNVLPQHP